MRSNQYYTSFDWSGLAIGQIKSTGGLIKMLENRWGQAVRKY